MFSAESFLSFVFANRRDTYYLDSGLRLDLNSYLWLELLRDNYKRIFFFNGIGQNMEAEVLDERSYEYMKGIKNKILTFLMPQESFPGRVHMRGVNKGPLRKWILKGLQGEEKQAFVFQLETFNDLFGGGGKEDLKKLISIEYNAPQHNLILLSIPVQIEESQHIFLKEDGVFSVSSPQGKKLCEEISDICSMGKIPLYDTMKERMKDRVVFLNLINDKKLRAIFDNLAMDDETRSYSEEQLLDYTAYLYYWCYCPKLRRQSQLFKDMTENVRFEDLYKNLSDKYGWKQFCERVSRIRENHNEPMRALLRELYADSSVFPVSMVWKNTTASRIQETELPADFSRREIPFADGIAANKRLIRLKEAYLTPWNRAPNLIVEKQVKMFLDFYDNALRQKDYGTMSRAVFVLYFCSGWLCEPDSVNDKLKEIFELMEIYIQLSEHYFKKEIEVEANKKELESKIEEQKILQQGQSTIAIELMRKCFNLSIQKKESLKKELDKVESMLMSQVFHSLEQIDVQAFHEKVQGFITIDLEAGQEVDLELLRRHAEQR